MSLVLCILLSHLSYQWISLSYKVQELEDQVEELEAEVKKLVLRKPTFSIEDIKDDDAKVNTEY